MTKERAIALRDKIVSIVVGEGQWVVMSEELRPDTKKIKLDISIMVDDKT